MDASFLLAAEELRGHAAGTGDRAWALYGLVRTTRPRRVLEIGMGYTTPFLLRALADNVAATGEERRRLEEGGPDAGDLEPAFHAVPYRPRLVACDVRARRAEAVQRTVRSLGLGDLLEVHACDFRELPDRLGPDAEPFDLTFFDCGGPSEYVDFLRGLWPLVHPRRGLMALDFTYRTDERVLADGSRRSLTLPGGVLDEIRRQQADAGRDAGFEVLSLVEPHKRRQGSMTLIRRLPPEDRVRGVGPGRDPARPGATDPGTFVLR